VQGLQSTDYKGHVWSSLYSLGYRYATLYFDTCSEPTLASYSLRINFPRESLVVDRFEELRSTFAAIQKQFQ
jgi:hypothetical protein